MVIIVSFLLLYYSKVSFASALGLELDDSVSFPFDEMNTYNLYLDELEGAYNFDSNSLDIQFQDDIFDNYMGSRLNSLIIEDSEKDFANISYYEKYNDEYNSSQTHSRHKRSVKDSLDLEVQFKEILDNALLITKTTSQKRKKKYYEKAMTAYNKYYKMVKNTIKPASYTALHVLRLEKQNIIMVQCAGGIWFPIKHVDKVITCDNAVLGFEPFGKRTAQKCDDYTCKTIKI